MKTEGKLLLAVVIAAAMAYGTSPDARAVAAAGGQTGEFTRPGVVPGASAQVGGVVAAVVAPEGR